MRGDKAHQFEPSPVCMTAPAWQTVLLLMSQSRPKTKIKRKGKSTLSILFQLFLLSSRVQQGILEEDLNRHNGRHVSRKLCSLMIFKLRSP